MGAWTLIIVIVVLVVPVVIANEIGKSKHRNGLAYGLLLGWLGVLILLVLPAAQAATPLSLNSAPPPGKKLCPECAELVQAAARVCKHCGYRFNSA
jgi:hypothetical protein